MAEAVYWVIRTEGLRLPPRRLIAGMAKISEATLSRRLRGRSPEELFVRELASARRLTHPPGWEPVDWEHWLPETEAELDDTRVWFACVQLAMGSPELRDVVREVWAHERRQLALADSASDPLLIEAAHALVVGLALRRALDDIEHGAAIASLRLVAAGAGLPAR